MTGGTSLMNLDGLMSVGQEGVCICATLSGICHGDEFKLKEQKWARAPGWLRPDTVDLQ